MYADFVGLLARAVRRSSPHDSNVPRDPPGLLNRVAPPNRAGPELPATARGLVRRGSPWARSSASGVCLPGTVSRPHGAPSWAMRWVSLMPSASVRGLLVLVEGQRPSRSSVLEARRRTRDPTAWGATWPGRCRSRRRVPDSDRGWDSLGHMRSAVGLCVSGRCPIGVGSSAALLRTVAVRWTSSFDPLPRQIHSLSGEGNW